MRINRKLNLVIPVIREDDDGKPQTAMHVHATPLHHEAFEANWYLLAQVFDGILGDGGVGRTAGPRVAGLMLRRIADAAKVDAGPLIAEMQRRATVLVPGADGYDHLPLHDAAAQGVLDEDELSEIEGALVFFMVGSALLKKGDTPMMWAGLRLWDGASSPLSATEYAISLKTSTEAATTGARATVLSTNS